MPLQRFHIDQWPHLCGVCLPEADAEIGLLVACDVPTIFDLLEVKHSQKGVLYASRTSMGWVVNGPLGRYHRAHALPVSLSIPTLNFIRW